MPHRSAPFAPARLWERWRRDPAVVQTVRSTAAATISYVVALGLSSEPAPLTAPLTALLVVQVTLYSTLKTSLRRVNSVVVGVLIAIAFSVLVGLTWWSLALVILASLVVGRFVRVEEFVPEVAISAMLVLGVTQVADTAWDRVLETLIGAVVGLLFNVVLVPPVWVDTAGDSIVDLARQMRRLLLDIGDELAAPDAFPPPGATDGPVPSPAPAERAAARLHEARRLDNDVADVDAALRQAEDSLRLNPRVKEGLLHRIVLRTGLDTLEISAVVLRVLARTLTDLAKQRGGTELFRRDTSLALEETLRALGDTLVSFAVLVTSHTSTGAETAEGRLSGELSSARSARNRAAGLLREEARHSPELWQLYGALLAEIDRVLDELDPDHRGRRLMEELDRNTQAREERRRRVTSFAARARGE
ncbi:MULTISPECIES: FUSC family protein [Streptomyces]|uniref:Aromatic acid exporter family protein n=1 Tax=Streptomyces solicathayae TaxID=3081768 RepID=A0ABZ0M3P8_9ACTN|nr:aromatic acid exporter family protein [Streptomyces sp. HUAS YS2]WOX26407.1 aromatic acid exporter family protein [Streptomyces sp. HUAS YS2]